MVLRSVLRHYGGERRSLAVLAGFGVLTAAAEAASLVALAPLLQSAADGQDTYEGAFGPFELELSVLQMSGLAAALIIIALALSLLGAYFSARVVSSFQYRRRLAFVDAFLEADWEVQSLSRDGRLVAYSLDFVNQSAAGLRDVAAMARYAAGLIVFIIGALLISWPATGAIAVTSMLIFYLQRPIRRRAARYSAETGECQVAVTEELATLDAAAREVNAYDVAGPASVQLRLESERQRHLRVRADVVTSLISPLFRTAGLLMLIGLIAWVATSGEMELASLGIVVLLLYRSLTYGQSLAGVHGKVVALAPRLQQLEDEQRSFEFAMSDHQSKRLHDAKSLTFTDVSYRYAGAESLALEKVGFTISHGETVGLVGPSGAGKSTVADLLVGLRRPSTGEVSANGVALTDLSRSSRAQLISIVPQSVSIIPGTIADNIAFFRQVTRERIAEAIDDVGLDEMISEMPDGIDTRIGDGARQVSGGQAQRIGIARAIAGDPSFVVLDEPTSALDPESEEVVTDMIGRLRSRVGTIVIAHRLSTLRHCDRVIVMEHGRITDDATLATLRSREGYLRTAFELGSLDWSERAAQRDQTQSIANSPASRD